MPKYHLFRPPDGRLDVIQDETGRHVADVHRGKSSLFVEAPNLLAACRAIFEFWQECKAEPKCRSVMLSPDALIGGHDGDEPIAIYDVLEAVLSRVEKGDAS